MSLGSHFRDYEVLCRSVNDIKQYSCSSVLYFPQTIVSSNADILVSDCQLSVHFDLRLVF